MNDQQKDAASPFREGSPETEKEKLGNKEKQE